MSADGSGIISQAGAVLLTKTLHVTGLDRQLSAGLQRWRAPRAVHHPGKIITDLAVALALGGDCLADVAVLRAQPELSGPVASDPVVSRLVTSLAALAPGPRQGRPGPPAPELAGSFGDTFRQEGRCVYADDRVSIS